MKKHNEFLPSNHIQADLQSVIRPLTITDAMVVASKFSIRDNFITSNTKTYIYISAFVNLLACSFHAGKAVISELRKYSFISLNLMIGLHTFMLILKIILNYTSGVTQSNTIVKIVLKLQEIDKNLEIVPGSGLKVQKKLVWGMFFLTVVLQLILAIVNIILYDHSALQFYITASRFLFDVNIILTTFINNFVATRLDIWCAKLNLHIVTQTNCDKGIVFNEPIESSVSHDLGSHSHINTTCLMKAYSDVLEVLRLTEKAFGLCVFFCAIEVFVLSLTVVQSKLLIKDTPFFVVTESTILVSVLHFACWTMKVFVLIIVLSSNCNMVLSGILKIKTVCQDALARNNQNPAVRRMCKNVVRVSSVRYVALSARGVFTVDATLPLRVSALVATYTVVLIELALL